MRKAEQFLKATCKLFQRHESILSADVKQRFQTLMKALHTALLAKDRENAKGLTKELVALSKTHLKKFKFSPSSLIDFSLSLFVALCIAIVIRQAAFEPYEIPSGSMQPTFKEKDRLIVSKTQFGLNIPLTTSHLLFNPENVKRMGVFTFTGENMDISNVKTNYFGIFPGYKQYIKRMIGLPGDSIYFYGGKLYGVDKYGNDISSQLQREELSYLEHIPFIHLEGQIVTAQPRGDLFSSVTIKQLNIPLAKLYLSPSKEVHYDLLHDTKADFHELFGMGNFATARIVTKENEHKLELTHHASVVRAKVAKDPYFRTRPMLHTEVSYIPLSVDHLKAIWDNLYTGRFFVENGQVYRYGLSRKEALKSPYNLHLAVPDGTYEFTQGKLYLVGSQGNLSLAPADHPLATFDVAKTLLLFNGGIECDTRFLPTSRDMNIPSSRYAYFRDGELYLMGAPILKREDAQLHKYLQTELNKQAASARYKPFLDAGRPSLETIKTFGVKVPEKHYLALGDNHAMSADSREFGFVPEDNVRGVPSFMFWGPGGRFGFQNHGIYPTITLPREVSWALLLASLALYRYRSRQKLKTLQV